MISCDSALVQSGSSHIDHNEGDTGIVTGVTGPHSRGAGQDNTIANLLQGVIVMFFQSQDCSKFKKEYCPVNDRSVIMVDNSIKTATDCQVRAQP